MVPCCLLLLLLLHRHRRRYCYRCDGWAVSRRKRETVGTCSLLYCRRPGS